MKKGLVFGIIALFIVTAVSPLVIGYELDAVKNERDEFRDLTPYLVNMGNGNHPPIIIDGNDDFTSENGVMGGSGTENDPFIIENWVIVNDSSTENGIFINNTDAFFVIRNCSVYNYSELWHGRGILLSHVENGRIEDTTTYENFYGIMVRDNSAYIEIINCTSGYSDGWNSRGIECIGSSYISISSSQFHNIYHGILLSDTPYGVIENSSIYNCSSMGIWITGDEKVHDYMINNSRIYNNHNGIDIGLKRYSNKQPGNIQISNCKIYDNGIPKPGVANGFPGITISNLHDNIIENCTIYHNWMGIGITSTTNTIIRNCSIFNHSFGTAMLAQGIQIAFTPGLNYETSHNEITHCDVFNNEVGIFLSTLSKSLIQKNNVFNNGFAGLTTSTLTRSKIKDNNIHDNGFFEAGDGVKITRLSYADLRNNWWGAEDGPNTFFNRGSGDTLYHWFGISRFRPWATEPIPDAGVQ